jgi:hypothetical protein
MPEVLRLGRKAVRVSTWGKEGKKALSMWQGLFP